MNEQVASADASRVHAAAASALSAALSRWAAPLPSRRFASVAAVEALARAAHAGQVDKSGAGYVDGHVARVAALAAPAGLLAVQVAWLHDTVEDTSVTFEQLRHLPVDPRVLVAVEALTHAAHEPRDVYYRRVRRVPLALLVKLADVVDNTSPLRLELLDEDTRQRLTAKYQKAVDALAATPGAG